MFKSVMVRSEREQKASDVSASCAGPSRLDLWTLTQASGWSFPATTFTAEKGWSKFLHYVIDSKSLPAYENQLDQLMERKSKPSLNCGDITHEESGSWNTVSRKYHRFLCL